MVRIVNWLLTRRCNLRCEYCGIIKNGGVKHINYFKENEITTERVIKLLYKFRTYNPNIFHIFYGGEPFLRRDLSDILKFCNDNGINYTVISNCSPDIRPRIRNVLNRVGWLKGFTASVDPSVLYDPVNNHSQMKSSWGFEMLMQLKHYDVDDLVAEVTMTKKTLDKTYELIQLLSSAGIYSSLTAIDINHNYGYDFSAYSDRRHLIKDSKKLRKLYNDLMSDDNILIHMKNEILPELFKHISSDYDCEMAKSVHNLTIDADGRLRTCLRIVGGRIQNINDHNIFNKYGDELVLHRDLQYLMGLDRISLCRGCNHTCVMMSKYIDNNEDDDKLLNH